VYVRDADGSAAVPIGEGYAATLSRDKKWAMAIKLTEPIHEIWLLPIGPGEPRRISVPNFTPANVFPQFLSDGKRVIYSGNNEAGHLPRVWLHDLKGGDSRPISAEGVVNFGVSRDDKWVVVGLRDPDAGNVNVALLSVDEGKVTDIKGLGHNEWPLGWTLDGFLYVAVANANGAGVKVDRLNPHTGARTPWRTLSTAPIGGVVPDPPIITPDGNTYGFDYRVRLSDLYTVTGVR
jgi:Tol biopolymer transport system component